MVTSGYGIMYIGPVLYCHDTVVLLPFLYGGHQYHTDSSKATVDPLDTLHLLSLRKKMSTIVHHGGLLELLWHFDPG